jgi:hypothetical protein
MNNITPEYGIYFKMVSFEIWNDTKNKELYDEVISFYEDKSSIVPFIIIGNEVFTGYNANNASKIEKAITDLYNTPKDERYDIMQELDKTSIADDANSIIKCESPNNTNVIVISIALLIIASSVFIVTMQTVRYRYVRNEFEYLQSDIDSLKEKINNLKGRQVIKKSPRKTNTKKDKNK